MWEPRKVTIFIYQAHSTQSWYSNFLKSDYNNLKLNAFQGKTCRKSLNKASNCHVMENSKCKVNFDNFRKSGNSGVPLCKSHPAKTLDYYIGDSKSKILIATKNYVDKVYILSLSIVSSGVCSILSKIAT